MKTPKIFSSAYSLFFENKNSAILWLFVRLYVGYEWFIAGYHKVTGVGSVKWVGAEAGSAVAGFVKGALTKTGGEHPDVSMWYAWFLENCVLPNASVWSYMVAYGEVLVGLGLIFGLFTYLASFFGVLMNVNYLLAGTVSSNPILLVLTILIMMARKVSGRIGLDYYFIEKRRQSPQG
jgi:thiosulfate dehydrogenase (quinone) large subunit